MTCELVGEKDGLCERAGLVSRDIGACKLLTDTLTQATPGLLSATPLVSSECRATLN